MKKGWKSKWLYGIIILTSIYFIIGVLLYFVQDLFLFHPKPLKPDHKFAFTQAYQEENILINGRNLSIIKFNPAIQPKGIVLFFHGNMENVEHYKQYPSIFTSQGYSTWMIDYPGFGKSTGKRTENIMYQDASLMYDQAVKLYQPSQILVYGKSIGTGVAAYLASVRKIDQLILESPYYGMEELMRHYIPIYPVSILTNYAFPIHSYLKMSNSPITIFHGTDDEVIPFDQSVRLKKENNNVELISIKGGNHNNLATYPLYKTKIDSLLSH